MKYYLFCLFSTGEVQRVVVPIIDVSREELGSGSGEGSTSDGIMTTTTSSGAQLTDFEAFSEIRGQLYAYYLSNTSIVLGTRSAARFSTDPDKNVQTAIGLLVGGRYVCKVENFANGTSKTTVDIQPTQRK